MTNADFTVIESEANYLNRLKPARIEVGRRRLARTAKKNGLDDDTREALWVARYMLKKHGNGVSAFLHLNGMLSSMKKGR